MRLMQGQYAPAMSWLILAPGALFLDCRGQAPGGARGSGRADHDAIDNAEDNARANSVSDQVEVIEGERDDNSSAAGARARGNRNILSSVLIAMLPAIKSSSPLEVRRFSPDHY
jgi:hypothetical protein